MMGKIIEDMGLLLDTRNIKLAREAVFGCDTLVTEKIVMEPNFTCFYVFEIYLIVAVLNT